MKLEKYFAPWVFGKDAGHQCCVNPVKTYWVKMCFVVKIKVILYKFARSVGTKTEAMGETS